MDAGRSPHGLRDHGAKIILTALLLTLPISAGRADDTIVETSHAVVEARDGERLRVVFAPTPPSTASGGGSVWGQPEVLFRPAKGSWDWAAANKLFIPVENLEAEPVTVVLRIDGSPGQELSGKLAIAPHSAGDLAIWIGAPSPRAMGMIAGPAAAATGTMPVIATEGSVDPSHITSVRLGIARPSTAQHMILGSLHTEPPGEAEKNAYDGIVDGFGQFRHGSWPEKIGSVEMLRARGAEEARNLTGLLAHAPKRDRYGGIDTAGGFRRSGYFRTERRDGRWWLVTPDGNPFFSIGMDVVQPGGATYVEGREFMFRDLPARDGELAAHWSERDDRRGLGAQRGRGFDHGHAFDFYRANLERKFGADWQAHWREETLARLEAWGFNTIGDWSEAELCAMHHLPYTVPLSPEGEFAKVSSGIDWWGPMPDVFDPDFAAAVDRMADHAGARFRSDPYLIGYFVDNELAWGSGSSTDPHQRYSIAVGVLAAGPQSPAKSAFIEELSERYREPQHLAEAWGIPLATWDSLRRAGFALPQESLVKPAVIADLAAFTRRFSEAYFRTVAEALRRHDPDHLYLGSRFAWQTPEAVEACAHSCDVVSFNRYRRSIAGDEEWRRFHALDKPALIGEFHFGSTDRGLFWEGLVGVGSESERGPAYARYLHAVADNPDFVGAHWFKYVDEPLTGRPLDGENAHIGFVSVADLPYDDLVTAARDANVAVLRELELRAFSR